MDLSLLIDSEVSEVCGERPRSAVVGELDREGNAVAAEEDGVRAVGVATDDKVEVEPEVEIAPVLLLLVSYSLVSDLTLRCFFLPDEACFLGEGVVRVVLGTGCDIVSAAPRAVGNVLSIARRLL